MLYQDHRKQVLGAPDPRGTPAVYIALILIFPTLTSFHIDIALVCSSSLSCAEDETCGSGYYLCDFNCFDIPKRQMESSKVSIPFYGPRSPWFTINWKLS